jgi:hypothetical protein
VPHKPLVLAQECRLPQDSPGERFRPRSGTLLWAPVAARRWGGAVLVRALPAMPLEIPKFAGWVAGAELAGPSWSGDRPLRLFSIHCPVGDRATCGPCTRSSTGSPRCGPVRT